MYTVHRTNIRSYWSRVLLISGSRIVAENRSSERDCIDAEEMIRPSLMDFCGVSAPAQNI